MRQLHHAKKAALSPQEASRESTSKIPPLLTVIGISVWLFLILYHIQSSANIAWAKYLDRWLLTSWDILPTVNAIFLQGKRLIALIFLVVVLGGNGRRMLLRLSINPGSLWEDAALSFSLGYGVFGTLLLLLGLVGLWQNYFLLTLMIIAFILAITPSVGFLREVKTRLHSIGKPTPLTIVAAAIFLGAWLYHLRYALIPETFYDALQYHLGLPNLYLLNGRIIATPENSYSGIPSLPQMIYGWTLVIDKWGILGSLLHCSMALAVGISLIAFACRLKRPEAGPIAVLMFYLSPVVLGESFRVSVGLEWTLMQVCGFMAFFTALTERSNSSERRGWIFLCGSFLGFAMATKYPAWFLVAAFVPPLVYLRSNIVIEKNSYETLNRAEILIVLILSSLLLLPWVAKNVFFYHNPLFPFYHEWFVPSAQYMPNWREISGGAGLNSLLNFHGIKTYFLHPWHFLAPAEDITESIGPLSLALLPLIVLVRLSKEEKILAWLCIGCWVPLSLFSSMTRFFIPHLAILILLEACLLTAVRPNWTKQILTLLVFVTCAITGIAWMVMDSNRRKLDVFLGRKAYGDFLAHNTVSYPTPPYAGIDYVNRETPPNAKLLIFGEARSFYLRRNFIAASSDQISPLEVWANASRDSKELKDQIDRQGINYILVNFGEISRRGLKPQISDQGLLNLDTFWKRYTLRVFGVQTPRDRWVGVYKLLDEDEAARPHSFDDLFGPYLQK